MNSRKSRELRKLAEETYQELMDSYKGQDMTFLTVKRIYKMLKQQEKGVTI